MLVIFVSTTAQNIYDVFPLILHTVVIAHMLSVELGTTYRMCRKKMKSCVMLNILYSCKSIAVKFTTVQDIQDYASLIFCDTVYVL